MSVDHFSRLRRVFINNRKIFRIFEVLNGRHMFSILLYVLHRNGWLETAGLPK